MTTATRRRPPRRGRTIHSNHEEQDRQPDTNPTPPKVATLEQLLLIAARNGARRVLVGRVESTPPEYGLVLENTRDRSGPRRGPRFDESQLISLAAELSDLTATASGEIPIPHAHLPDTMTKATASWCNRGFIGHSHGFAIRLDYQDQP